MLTRRTPMRRTRMKAVGTKGRQRMARLADVRPEILARASGRCEVPWCRRPVRLDLHHVERRSAGGADTSDNLLALCRVCHRATEAALRSRTGRLCILPDLEARGRYLFRICTSHEELLAWLTEVQSGIIQRTPHQGGA